MHGRTLLLLAPALATLPACDMAADAPPTVLRTDSAGITIVASSAAAWTPATAWTVDPAPEVEIGHSDGEPAYLLSQVEGAVRYDDGRIVVANRQTNELRIYAADGTFQRALGRSGSGPGEYEYLRAVLRCGGDSIFGFDLNWQMNVYGPHGAVAREEVLEVPGSFRSPYALACGTQGVFVASGWGEPVRPDGPGFFRSRAPITLFGGDREPVTLADTLSSERMAYERGTGPHPLGRSATMAVGPRAVYLSTGESFDVAVYDLNGRLTALYRAPGEDVAITDAHVAAYREAQLANAPPGQRQAVERSLGDLAAPGSFPTYTRLTAATDGHLWAERFTPPGEAGARWAVFAPDGAFLGHVDMPPDLEVTEIGADYVLGIHRDAFDVERVRLHRVLRPGS